MVWIPHEAGLTLMGQLPASISVRVLAEVFGPLPGPVDEVDVYVPPFLAGSTAVQLAQKLPNVQLVQLMSAGADAWVGKLAPGVHLCDARGVHSSSTAEWAAAVILAQLRQLPAFARSQAAREWSFREYAPTDELAGKRVLIIGAGAIGEALAARLTPFEVSLTMVARSARPGIHSVAELPELLPEADVVVLLLPLTPQTTGLVDAAFLARMPDGALLVNGARGPVVDTEALTAELASGRLSAAVDVTDPEPLPPEHPLWTMPNFLLTPHVGGSVRGLPKRAYALVGDQLRRLAAGQPLINEVRDGY